MSESPRKLLKSGQSIKLSDEERSALGGSLTQFMQSEQAREGVEERVAAMAALSEGLHEAHILADHERHQVRDMLIGFMKENPQRDHVLDAAADMPGVRDVLSSFFGSFLPRTVAFAAFFLITGTGITYAAQSSVPGDVLYPVKVRIVEPVARTLAVTEHARAEFDAKVSLRRLQEVESIAQRKGTRAEADDAYVKHVESARAYIQKVEKAGRSSAARRLSDDLDVFVRRLSSSASVSSEAVTSGSSASSSNSEDSLIGDDLLPVIIPAAVTSAAHSVIPVPAVTTSQPATSSSTSSHGVVPGIGTSSAIAPPVSSASAPTSSAAISSVQPEQTITLPVIPVEIPVPDLGL